MQCNAKLIVGLYLYPNAMHVFGKMGMGMGWACIHALHVMINDNDNGDDNSDVDGTWQGF